MCRTATHIRSSVSVIAGVHTIAVAQLIVTGTADIPMDCYCTVHICQGLSRLVFSENGLKIAPKFPLAMYQCSGILMDIARSYQLVSNGGVERVNYAAAQIFVMVLEENILWIIWNLQQPHAVHRFAHKKLYRHRYGINSTRSNSRVSYCNWKNSLPDENDDRKYWVLFCNGKRCISLTVKIHSVIYCHL